MATAVRATALDAGYQKVQVEDDLGFRVSLVPSERK
jgi:hypothetical protein